MATGDIDGGDNNAIVEWEQSKMNIFTIIGVVVVVILVAGYFGVHGISF